MPIFGSIPIVPSAGHHRSASLADDIEFEIKGAELPFAEIELDELGGTLVCPKDSFLSVLGPLGGILDGDNS